MLFNLEKCNILLCLHSSTYIDWPIKTKPGQNVYSHKISDEFNFERNWTSMLRVICPWIWKNAIFYFVYTLAPLFIDQSRPNMVKMYIAIRSGMSSILSEIGRSGQELSALEFEKNIIFYFVYTLALSFLKWSSSSFVTMHIFIKSRMSLNLSQNGLVSPELGPFEFGKMQYFTLFTL